MTPTWLAWPSGSPTPDAPRRKADTPDRARKEWIRSLPKATRLFSCHHQGQRYTVYAVAGMDGPYVCDEPMEAIGPAIVMGDGEVAASITGGSGPMARRFSPIVLHPTQMERFSRTMRKGG